MNILESMFLENQNWPKVKKYLEKSKIIIIPIGSIENEGKHLPLGIDTHVSTFLSNCLSEKTGCIVGPCLPIGYSEWFMEFPGTISFKYETLIVLIRELG